MGHSISEVYFTTRISNIRLYSVNMGSISLSRALWDPAIVLGVDPEDPECRCVGLAVSTKQRCRWPLYETNQFHPSQREAAIQRLESMSEMHPSNVDRAALIALAQNTMCREWHRKYAYDQSTKWIVKIQTYLDKHSQGPAGSRPLTQLQNGFANDAHASERELQAARRALERVKAELDESENRCSGLIEKNGRLDRQREEEVERLRRQLAVEKIESGKQLAGRNANFEKNVAASSREMDRLRARVRELEALNRKYDDSRGEDTARVSRLQEQSRKVELLTRQVEVVSRELEQREVGGSIKGRFGRR